MSDAITYCKNCETSVMCHLERKCMRQAHGLPLSGSQCKCGEDSTGWMEVKCCNVCGLPHAAEALEWRMGGGRFAEALDHLLRVAEPMDGIETLREACVEARRILSANSKS